MLLTLAVGLYPQPVLELADTAAEQLLDTQAYRDAVLGPYWLETHASGVTYRPDVLLQGGAP